MFSSSCGVISYPHISVKFTCKSVMTLSKLFWKRLSKQSGLRLSRYNDKNLFHDASYSSKKVLSMSKITCWIWWDWNCWYKACNQYNFQQLADKYIFRKQVNSMIIDIYSMSLITFSNFHLLLSLFFCLLEHQSHRSSEMKP